MIATMDATRWLMDYRDFSFVMSLRLRRRGCQVGADLYPFQPGVENQFSEVSKRRAYFWNQKLEDLVEKTAESLGGFQLVFCCLWTHFKKDCICI
jgi:hypothetical protein